MPAMGICEKKPKAWRARAPLQLARRFGADRRGITAVEFGLISSVLIMFLVGIVEFSLVMLAKNSLEAATNISSRLGKTGFVSTGMTQEQTLIAEIERRTGGIIDTSKLEITSLAYSQFDQIGKPEPWNDANNDGIPQLGEYTDINGNGQWDQDMGVSGLGGSGQVVVYTVSYPWHIFTPLASSFLGTNGTLMLVARSVVKNEPF